MRTIELERVMELECVLEAAVGRLGASDLLEQAPLVRPLARTRRHGACRLACQNLQSDEALLPEVTAYIRISDRRREANDGAYW